MQPRPSSSSDAPGKADDDVLEATTWGASDPAIRAQLERELAAIRGQLAMRQRISEGRRQLAQFDNPAFESVRPPTADGDVSDVASETSSWRSSRPPSAAAKYAQPPPRDKVAERVDKKVRAFEALIVRKLVARTPLGGPTGVGALKTLTRAFEYYDAEGDGSVDVASLSRVLAKLNVITELPPPRAERETIQAMFDKHARKTGGELVYATFARELLHSSGTLVPAVEVMAEQERSQWRYSEAVQQALDRRCLANSTNRPPDSTLFREAWTDASAAARHIEEGLHPSTVPRRDVIGAKDRAGLRGRLPGGVDGFKEYRKMVAQEKASAAQMRAQDAVDGASLRMQERLGDDRRREEALSGWKKIEEQNRQLGGMTPGQAMAAARRRRG